MFSLVVIVLTTYVTWPSASATQVIIGLRSQRCQNETFPDAKDLKSIVISLTYTGGAFCFPCDYSLRITGEGEVEYYSEGGYYVTGPHRGRITDDELTQLLEAFKEADFYSLEDESEETVLDASTTAISLSFGSRSRRVVNRMNKSPRFDQLTRKICELSHADKWLCGNADTVPSLLADKDNLNLPGGEGETVLMWACRRKDATAVQKFLAAGANLHAKDRYGRTALMYAAARGMPEAVEVLLQAGADAEEFDGDGETPLIYAAGIRDVWFSRWFYGHSSISWGPIINLFGDSSPEVIQMLLRAGADPNASDSEGATPLMYAAESSKAGTGILRALVDGGANLNEQDDQRRTALMRAVDKYRVDAVRFLITAKADPNLRDSHGHTALGRLHSPRDKLFRHSPEYRQIRLVLQQAGAVR